MILSLKSSRTFVYTRDDVKSYMFINVLIPRFKKKIFIQYVFNFIFQRLRSYFFVHFKSLNSQHVRINKSLLIWTCLSSSI